MKLFTSIYHANYELDPSSGLAIISLENKELKCKISKLSSLDLKAISLGVKEILDLMCTMFFFPIWPSDLDPCPT